MNFIEDFSCKHLSSLELSAIISNGCNITYRELIEEVKKTADALQQFNIPKNMPVAVLSDNNKDFIIFILALWLIDAVPVTINTRLTRRETEELINSSGSSILFIHTELTKKLNNKFPTAVTFPLKKRMKACGEIVSQKDITNTAVIIFTSGSSGKPKGVILSFNNLLRSAEIGNSFLEHTNSDRWLASLPFYHIGGFSIITRALYFGASIIIPASLKNEDVLQSLQKFKPTLASFVGTQMERLIDSDVKPGKELRHILLGGGFINNSLIVKSLKSGWKISKVYGSSETSSFVTALSTIELKKKINSAGKPLPGNKIIICDENKIELPRNIAGEIVVKSDSVTQGYINNTEETKKKLIKGFYYTGDSGYLDDDGYLFVQARRTDLIISGGENINPAEIESEIYKYNGIKECCVIGIEDNSWGHLVAAAIVSNKERFVTGDLLRFLKMSLAGYKIPKIILRVEAIPKNELGKIDKEKLKSLFLKK